MKYRLKKDTPEFKAGQMFTRGEDEHGNDCLFAGGAPLPAFDISLTDDFNEWFEEVKEEPKWVRKQIKRMDVTSPEKENGYGDKYTDVNYRFIKPFYYDDEEWGVQYYAKNSTSYQRFFENSKSDPDAVVFINQLVRDGYIEIEDNPNIVWEDEKCD